LPLALAFLSRVSMNAVFRNSIKAKDATWHRPERVAVSTRSKSGLCLQDMPSLRSGACVDSDQDPPKSLNTVNNGLEAGIYQLLNAECSTPSC